MSKGDTYRPVNNETYDINWNAIYNPPVCEECGESMRQWLLGHRIYYCRNKLCNSYLKKIEFKKD